MSLSGLALTGLGIVPNVVIEAPPPELVRIVPVMTSPTTPPPFVVNQSSASNVDFRGWRLFDREPFGQTSSVGRWLTTSGAITNQWVSIDLGQNYTVSRIILTTEFTTARFPRDYRLEYSGDEVSWQTAIEVFDASRSGANTTQPPVDFPAQTARYWRLLVLRNWGDATFIAVREMQLWGF